MVNVIEQNFIQDKRLNEYLGTFKGSDEYLGIFKGFLEDHKTDGKNVVPVYG